MSFDASNRRDRFMRRTHALTSEISQGDHPDQQLLLSTHSYWSSQVESVDSGETTLESERNFLTAPTLLESLPEQHEKPPYVNESLEKIPLRVRSQSWLIRTRLMLLGEPKQTPVISTCLLTMSIILVIITFPISLFFCLRTTREYERAVVMRLGRLLGTGMKGPGLFFILPCVDTVQIVDQRVLSFDVPPQEILSRDSVTVSVDAVIFFRVSDPVISVTNVNDAQFSTKLLAQTTLRNVLGTRTLSEMLSERDSIASVIEKVLEQGTDPWGVQVQRVEIKDIRLPHQLLRSMAAEAEAARDARALIIQADGERKASKSLSEAAQVIGDSKVSLHLRYLQTMTDIAAEHNSTIVMPVPVELVRHFAAKFNKVA